MRLMSKRAQAEQAAAMRILRGRIRDLEAELLESGRANGRLARRTGDVEAAAANVASALRAGRRDLVAENHRLRELVDQLRRDRDGLRRQLDDALYGDDVPTAIAAGNGEPKVKAAL